MAVTSSIVLKLFIVLSDLVNMRVRRYILLAPVAAILLLSGCIYERLDIYSGSDFYTGTILSDHHDVEVDGRRIVMKPGARFAIKTPDATQWIGQFDVTIASGDGMRVYLRTVADRFDSTHGVAFRYATDGCTLRTADGRTIPLNFNAESDNQTLSFNNEADLMTISVGCNKLYEEESALPATEYIIFETLPGSTVELRAVTYFNTDAE